MLLRNKNVSGFVLLIAGALCGLLIIQAVLLKDAYLSKETAFKRNVLAIISVASQKLATREVISFAFDSDTTFTSIRSPRIITINVTDEIMEGAEIRKELVSTGEDFSLPPFLIENDSLKFLAKYDQRIRLESIDPVGGEHILVLDTICIPGWNSFDLGNFKFSGGNYYLKATTDSTSIIFQAKTGSSLEMIQLPQTDKEHQEMMMHVVASLQDVEHRPIEDRINLVELDSIITGQLRESDIDLEFTLAVLDNQDSLRLANDSSDLQALLSSEIRAPLFPQSFLSEPADLVLYFPGRTAWVWRQVLPLAVPSAILIFIIIGCFVYSIRTILSQRRFADHVADFVGNMTHEFKTPLATVQLACEAIARDDVSRDPDQVRLFNDTILRESMRMKDQAEKILQISELEEGNLELNLEFIDISELINNCIEGIDLQIKKRNGSLERDLHPNLPMVRGDKFHLTHAISNVLENANKYSQENPQIRIVASTDDGNKMIKISVFDRGIGIEKEHCKQVMEKYYRVPQGNIHDVKGFGLGLSYVKQIIELLGGKVTIFSEFGQGTEVEIMLPIADQTQGKP